MYTITSLWNRTVVRGDRNGAVYPAAPLRVPTGTSVSSASNSKSDIRVRLPVEFPYLSSWLSDVGLCARALGSGCGTVQVGPQGHLHPRLSGTAAFGNRQVEGPCEVSRVSGAPAER